jgi:hypothetical protein
VATLRLFFPKSNKQIPYILYLILWSFFVFCLFSSSSFVFLELMFVLLYKCSFSLFSHAFFDSYGSSGTTFSYFIWFGNRGSFVSSLVKEL